MLRRTANAPGLLQGRCGGWGLGERRPHDLDQRIDLEWLWHQVVHAAVARTLLQVADSTARERKIAWEDAQLVSGRGLSNGRYRFI